MRLWTCLCLFVALEALSAAQPSSSPVILQGDIRGTQNQTYIEVPFQVPPGVHRISVDFSYSGRDQRTTLDLGIIDPNRFRGASGGNKSHFTISEMDATPSYLPGPIPAGEWKLLIAVPNIRPGNMSHYRAEIQFNNPVEDHGFLISPISSGSRWYRGDLHMHTAHSDGSCTSQGGKRVPCPVFLTAKAAADHGLDFIAITDHNTTSHYDSIRELQPYFDRLLFIPGREITTFWGHFNVFGVTEFIDYRAVAHDGLNVNNVLNDVRAKGGIASINHADAPSGEACMGCGWTPPGPVDMSLFTGIEAINGGEPLLSVDFWDKEIAQGYRLAAIGGSDNHNATIPIDKTAAIGRPTTVVETNELSVPAIIEGIRRGRVFVDLTASHDKLLDLEAHAGAGLAAMGGDLSAAAGTAVDVNIHVVACTGNNVTLLLDGHDSTEVRARELTKQDEIVHAQWTSDGKRHWLRAEVRDSRGALLVLGNPVYINFPPR